MKATGRTLAVIGVCGLGLLLLWIAVTASPGAVNGPSGRLQVVATFFPLYDFARNIGGDRVTVSLLVPQGAELHDWEPTPGAIRRADAAAVLIYNGVGLEPWIDQVKQALRPGIRFVDTSEGLELLALEEGENDPHLWLDPVNAKHQVSQIRDALATTDPTNKDLYQANAEAYLARLDALHNEIQSSLAKCSRKEFISFHESFSYFAKRYGLSQLYLLGGGEEEPSPQDMARVIETAKEKGIQVVYSEPLRDPRLAEVVADQLSGGTILVLDPLEEVSQDEIQAGKEYLGSMQQNLRNLMKGLDCRP